MKDSSAPFRQLKLWLARAYHWSGLGYYRRAENLKKSAGVLVREHAGRLPDNYASLLALPGVGDYTAGAVMSIAFGQPYPALDGNARRVLGRVFEPKNEQGLRAIANRLVPTSRPGYFNQGLMELGATICTSYKPRCLQCPVASICAARIADAPLTRSGSTPNPTESSSSASSSSDPARMRRCAL